MVEPEWDQQTRDLVLGHADVHLCPLCGWPTEICQNPENQDRAVAGAPIRCHVTTAQLAKQSQFTEETNPHLAALLWPVSVAGGEGSVT